MIYLEKNNEIMMKVDGFFNLKKDKEAIIEFQKEIDNKMISFDDYIQRIEYLIQNDYYVDFFETYSKSDILKIKETIYSINFEFQSFMAISKFYKDYSLKSNDKQKYLETYQDRIISASLYLAQGDIDLAISMGLSMINQQYQPATPTFLNAGKARRGEMVSCFLLELDDTLNSISFNIGTSMQLSKIGGGVALNLSKLRGKSETIKDVSHACKGIVPVMKLLEDSFSYADQMGQRKGAGAVYLNIFHWDVEDFLDTKKINSDEKSRIQTLSVALIISDKFFELAKENKQIALFAPLTVYKQYNKHMDDMDMDIMYNKLLENNKVQKKLINARQLLIKIAQTQFESGYPYIVYKSTANKFNPLKNVGDIKMSNLCTEIFQIQKTSIINNYGEEDEIGYDVSCNLGSLNIANTMESKDIRSIVHTAVDALTCVSILSNVNNAPSISKANRDFHSIGLGAMNLHGFLAKNHINYESDEARDFVRTFFMIINYYSIEKSMLIAKEKDETFKYFDKSDYASGVYFDKYLEEDFSPKTDIIKNIFKDIPIPDINKWDSLKNEVMQNGLYHAYRLAIAPTQSISYIQNSTPSIAPIVDHIETRTYGNATTYYPMPYLSSDNFFFYKSAYNMDMKNVIDLVSEVQNHVDQGISTTLFATNNTTTRDLAKLYIYAWQKGLKSLYYTRTKNLTIENCMACSV
ncbi:MAG: class 1b ribonucleoside-diphosphate reductase subunit alpha [Oscillospiraceae bacterium]|nr:class 1b ribonucleoside-diphosphate reductase subunit alpha [Oscillospiraceae bacterium]